MNMSKKQLRAIRKRHACIALYVAGYGRIMLIHIFGEWNVWKYTGKIGEWANRHIYNEAIERILS